MDRINKNNYEVYFLDYHEGRLNSEEKQDLYAFIREFPEFYDEFEDYGDLKLPTPDINYPDKTELYKTEVSIPEADDWEFRCIAFMEGDLSLDEIAAFEKERNSDPEKAKISELYIATRSLPQTEIKYANKAALKKKVVLIPRWVYGVVSAAAIVIFGWLIFTPQSQNIQQNQLAKDSIRETNIPAKLPRLENSELVASVEPESVKPVKSTITEIPDITISEKVQVYPEEQMSREIFAMAELPSIMPGIITSGLEQIPPAGSLMAFRYIPGPEEDEYHTLVAFSGDFIRKQLLGQDPELVKKSRFSFWELADAGLEKLSNIFGFGADIEREYSDSGELLAVSFESSLVGFNTPIKRGSSAQTD